MKQKIFGCIMVVIVMCCSFSTIVLRSNAISSEIDINRSVNQLKTELNANFKARLDTQAILKELNADYIDVANHHFVTNPVTEKISVNQYSKGYLEYALIAEQFFDSVETNHSTLTEQQAYGLRNQCNQIFDTLKTLNNKIVEMNGLSLEEKLTLNDIYVELQGREEQINKLFPTDYYREFVKNAELTKQFIITEYSSVSELRNKGPKYVQRIDDLITKVKQGIVDSEDGNRQIDDIWTEWNQQ